MIALYLDEHIPAAVTRGLKRRGVDVLTTQDAENSGKSDAEQLAFARQIGRVLVTFDSDYLVLADKGREHSGIFYCTASKYTTGELISALRIDCEVFLAEEMYNNIEFL